MIPDSNINVDLEVTDGIETTKTYKLSNDKIQGYIDGLEALKQAIYKVLNTEKYEYQIYSFNYGIELESLVGKDIDYVKIELKRRIKECLLRDLRIESIYNFDFKVTCDELYCAFEVTSIYGDFSISKEVSI